MVFLLLFLIIIIFIINLYINNKDYLSPSVVFTFSFIFSIFWACIYWKKWELELGINTFFVIILGIFFFSITCNIIKLNFSKNRVKLQKQELNYFHIKRKLEYIFIIFSIFTLIMAIMHLLKSVNSDLIHIRTALYKYRDLTTFRDDKIGFPFYIDICTGILHAGGFWFIFIFINNYMVNKKIDFIKIIIITLCIISTIIEGSRAMVINYLFFAVASILILINKQHAFVSSLKLKLIFRFFLVGIIFLLLFKESAILIGRDNVSDFSLIDYIAIYAGAEIKNLDIFMQENYDKFYYGQYTFSSLVSRFGAKVNYEFTFRSINGYSLGNVYTIFYHFYRDLGYAGIIFFSSFMALVCQIIYEKCKVNKLNNKPSLVLIIYPYITGGIFFSFFSNNFFSLIFTVSFIEYLIAWKMFNYFFVKSNTNKIKVER